MIFVTFFYHAHPVKLTDFRANQLKTFNFLLPRVVVGMYMASDISNPFLDQFHPLLDSKSVENLIKSSLFVSFIVFL